MAFGRSQDMRGTFEGARLNLIVRSLAKQAGSSRLFSLLTRLCHMAHDSRQAARLLLNGSRMTAQTSDIEWQVG